jgi:hypothetical protein
MDELPEREFAALRETIRTRGTARPLAALGGLAAWAAVLATVLIWLPYPMAAVLPLLVLLTAFEVVRTIHLGVERLGRYIQVFFEEGAGGHPPSGPPAWEHVAMRFGPSLPGAGGHPLFQPIFLLAIIVNFLAVILPGPLPVEVTALAVPHVASIAWIVYCDRGMRKQRASDLARFREIRESLRS